MPETFVPAGTTDVVDTIRWAVAESKPLDLHGHRSKAGLGRPSQSAYALDLGRLQGVLDYEPAELTLTARPGTQISDIEKLLAAGNQMLAFEPPDFGPLWWPRRTRHAWRRHRLQPRRPAALQGRRHPRPSARLHGRFRSRRDFQGRRQGGEERHRL